MQRPHSPAAIARTGAARLTPTPLKRLYQRLLDARFNALVDRPTNEIVARYGLTVARGPFAGMRYVMGVESWSRDLVAKLSGQYESELHPAIAEWIEAAPKHMVDVGCAEGFYAVGCALAIPGAVVHAYDVDPTARENCARLARHNRVADRVLIGGACTIESFLHLPEADVVLLVDCEGCERELLNPEAAPVLRRWPIIVELHEFLDSGIAETIVERFAGSHEVDLVAQRPRHPSAVPELADVSARTAAALLSERRPALMRWAVLRPKNA